VGGGKNGLIGGPPPGPGATARGGFLGAGGGRNFFRVPNHRGKKGGRGAEKGGEGSDYQKCVGSKGGGEQAGGGGDRQGPFGKLSFRSSRG